MQRILAVLMCILGLLAPRALYACAVCVELPEASIADHILSADVIVFAQPSPENRFKFSAHRVLESGRIGLKDVPEIPFLVDSVTRRAFRADPKTTVLLTYGPKSNDRAGRGFSRGWRRIFIMNPDRSAFLERLQTTGGLWSSGETGSPERVSFFAEYLWHPDQALHNMAMVEIGRAPYAIVRPIGGRFATKQILSELSDLNRFAYRSVAIRLLGLQTDPQARSIVRSRYLKSLKSGGLNSYEWTLAGIEVDGTSAIKAVGLALQDRGRSVKHKHLLIRALTDAGSLNEGFRPEVVQILSVALESDRELASQIAIATRNWGPSALHQQLKALATLEETDPPTQFILNMTLGTETASD